MNLREIISLKQIWDKSSATVSWRKRITHTSVLMLWYARLVTTIPPYVILSGFTDGNLTLKGVEIATSNLERREKFVHPVLRTGATIFTENHDTGTYTTNFPDKRLTSFEPVWADICFILRCISDYSWNDVMVSWSCIFGISTSKCPSILDCNFRPWETPNVLKFYRGVLETKFV